MRDAYAVYTVRHGRVKKGAEVQLPSYGGRVHNLPAVVVGEPGLLWRNALGIIPVEGSERTPCPLRAKEEFYTSYPVCRLCFTPLVLVNGRGYKARHPSNEGEAYGRLQYARIVELKRRRFRFIAEPEATTQDEVIAVFETPIGYRGTNNHSGDRCGWHCRCGTIGDELVPPAVCPTCGDNREWVLGWPRPRYHPFPGRILAQGRMVKDAAGKTRGGKQIIALLPKGVVFRTECTGQLPVRSSVEYYYLWNGKHLLVGATYEKRLF